MKRFLAPILLVTLLFPSFALGLELDDLVQRGGLYYEKFSDVPFSGKVTGLYQGSFKDGMKDGPFVSYLSSGQLHHKGTYKDGKEDGTWFFYYVGGQLFFKGTYKDGKEDGPWVWYLEDGTVDDARTGTYKDGVRVE